MAALESRLSLKATDDTAAAFASVSDRITRLQAQIAGLSGGIGAVSGSAAPPGAATRVAPAPAPAAAGRAPSPADTGGFWTMAGNILAAAVGYKALKGGFDEAMAQQHERLRQEVASMSAEEISRGEHLAADLAGRYPSVPQSSIMHTLRTARTVTGSFEEATPALEPLTKLRVIAQAANPHASAEDMQEEFDKLVKALEIAGVATDPEKLKKYTNDIAKSLNAFGDQLKPSDYFEMLKYARQAAPGLSERFLMTSLATFGTEIGGASAGTAAAAFNQTMISGNPRYFTHTGAQTLAALGLVNEEDLTRTKTGEIMGMKPFHHVKDWRLARSDPDLWITQELLPAIKAKFGDDPDMVAATIGQVFNNRNAANLALQIALQQKKFGKNAELWKEAQDLQAAGLLSGKDASTVFSGLGNSVNRAVADHFDLDLFAQLGRGVNRALDFATPSRMTDEDMKKRGEEERGWLSRLWDSIHIGAPRWDSSQKAIRDWHDDMAVRSSFWNAGYRNDELKPEMAREAARGAALSALGQPKIDVGVQGQAQVDQTIHIDVSLDPALRAEIDQVRTMFGFDVPLNQAPTGRMDGDAAPQRGAFGLPGHL